jgi:hypothetical protein
MVRDADGKLQESKAQETTYRQYCATHNIALLNGSYIGMRPLYMPKEHVSQIPAWFFIQAMHMWLKSFDLSCSFIPATLLQDL